MALSLKDLLTPVSAEDVLSTMLATLGSLGFGVTSWVEGSIPLTICETFAEAVSDASESVAAIAAGGYLDLAEGVWLTLLAKGMFDLDRIEATFTKGYVTLTAATGAGPETISADQLTISNGDEREYRNGNIVEGIPDTLPAGPSTLALLPITAVSPGSAYNVGNDELTTLVTPLPGVTVNNPATGSGTWITEAGRDEETDAELRIRCRVRWATLAKNGPGDAYVSWALQASQTITRVAVDVQNPNGPGSVRVYLANASGSATAPEITAVNSTVQRNKPITAAVEVLAAPEQNVAITATVYARASGAPTDAQCEAAVEAYFKTLAIGGDTIPALAPARIFVDLIEAAIKAVAPTSIVTIVLTNPPADVVLDDFEVAVPTPISITVIPV